MRIEITKLRRMANLILTNELGFRQIGRMVETTHQTVSKYAQEIRQLGITKEKLNQLDNMQLESLFKKKSINLNLDNDIDWAFIDKEHQVRNVPLVVLWIEYTGEMQRSNREHLSNSSFRRKYRQWKKSQRISMRQFHEPGQKVFVDYAGKTVPIFCEETGEVKAAQIFVGTLGASGLIFAYAVESQKISDWLTCHVEMFKYFNGVPKFIVPDNLRSAVNKHTSMEVVINRSYQELAEYYNTIILPARVRKPKDKSLAEVSVRIIQDWALNRLRNIKFFSLADLNSQLMEQLEILNRRVTVTYPESRLTRFLNREKECLSSLPEQPFTVAIWRYGLRVPDDYHIKYENCFYSVPYQYRQQLVDIRVTSTTLEIFNGVKRIGSHRLIEMGCSTDVNHMPASHKIIHDNSFAELQDWASSFGENTIKWCRHQLEHKSSFANGKKSVENLRKLSRLINNAERIESACSFAIGVNNFSFTYLRDVISRNFDIKPVPEKTFFVTKHENIRGKESFANLEKKSC